MPISRNEAADALRTVETTEQLSGELHGYEAASPYFMVWGFVWAYGYAVTAAIPAYRELIWATAIATGVLASIYFSIRQGKRSTLFRRPLAIACLVAVAAVLTSAVVAPPTMNTDALLPLIFAAAYVVAGIWGGVRYVICGAVLGAVALAGYFLPDDVFGYWMGAAGGGILFLTGLWLRKA